MIKPLLDKWRLTEIGRGLGYAFMIALFVLTLLVVTTIIWGSYFNLPPLTMKSLDPPDLGVLYPGEKYEMHFHIHINEPIITFYYVNTMNADLSAGFPGTQKAFTDNIYPKPATFDLTLPWTVPDLPPGRYRRVFAGRNTNGSQKVLFIFNSFTIGEVPNGEPLPNH